MVGLPSIMFRWLRPDDLLIAMVIHTNVNVNKTFTHSVVI